MPWLLREGQVLAAVEVARGHRERRRGLLGRDDIEGVLLLWPARGVHTMGMRFAIDVAHCRQRSDVVPRAPSSDAVPDVAHAGLIVLAATTMPRWRVGRPRWRACCVIEARAGAFARWKLRPGDALEIR